MKNSSPKIKEDFLTTLSSITPEEVTELILRKSKIKIMKNIVQKIK